jgi:3-oxoacyl-[acyl-carrier protein] reductase
MVDRRTPNVVFPSLSDRVAIITGAGQGLGCAFAKGFAAVGAISIIAERNGERGEAVAAEIAAAGGKARAITTDVADPASLENIIAVRGDSARGMVGGAQGQCHRPVPVLPRSAAGNAARAVGPHRQYGLGRGDARAAKLPPLHHVQGRARRHTRSMARELGRDGITVNAILPGAISTEIQRKTVTPEQKQRIVAMQCIPRPEVPEDLVGTVLFLASDASAFLTGQALTVDGGATHT